MLSISCPRNLEFGPTGLSVRCEACPAETTSNEAPKASFQLTQSVCILPEAKYDKLKRRPEIDEIKERPPPVHETPSLYTQNETIRLLLLKGMHI